MLAVLKPLLSKRGGMELTTAPLNASTGRLAMLEPGSGLVHRQLCDMSLRVTGCPELLGSMGDRFLSQPSHTPSMGFSHLPTLQTLSHALAFHCTVKSKTR